MTTKYVKEVYSRAEMDTLRAALKLAVAHLHSANMQPSSLVPLAGLALFLVVRSRPDDLHEEVIHAAEVARQLLDADHKRAQA